jgi:16S rRNA (adenine1518-N6/adenine1519-N6)-dimethyltransferase
MARQRLGQHFLEDTDWREQIARAIRVSPHSMHWQPPAAAGNSCWIEVGAGHGEMTEHLVSSGLPVYALELDPLLVAGLRRLADKHKNLTVVPGDVLKMDLAAIAGGRRIRVYGNLPYYITSPILHHFFEYAGEIEEIHIVIQLEVALRLTAQPGTKSYGYLSVITQFYARPELMLEIPRSAFRPAPEVGSGLVTLRLRGEGRKLGIEKVEVFLAFVKMCFAQKRKKLSNNLGAIAEPRRVREVLRSLKIREDARAEQLSVVELATLHRAISSGCSASDLDSQT